MPVEVARELSPALGIGSVADGIFESSNRQAVGERWPVDKARLVELDPTVETPAENVDGSATLVGVREVDGLQLLEIEGRVELRNLPMPEGVLPAPFEVVDDAAGRAKPVRGLYLVDGKVRFEDMPKQVQHSPSSVVVKDATAARVSVVRGLYPTDPTQQPVLIRGEHVAEVTLSIPADWDTPPQGIRVFRTGAYPAGKLLFWNFDEITHVTTTMVTRVQYQQFPIKPLLPE